jgi:hypothetical protein
MKKITITIEKDTIKIETDTDISAYEAMGIYRYLERSLFVAMYVNDTKPKKKTKKL